MAWLASYICVVRLLNNLRWICETHVWRAHVFAKRMPFLSKCIKSYTQFRPGTRFTKMWSFNAFRKHKHIHTHSLTTHALIKVNTAGARHLHRDETITKYKHRAPTIHLLIPHMCVAFIYTCKDRVPYCVLFYICIHVFCQHNLMTMFCWRWKLTENSEYMYIWN